MPGYTYKGAGDHETRGRPRTFNDDLCGTNAGYMQHYRRKKKACDDCKAAHSRYTTEKKKAS